VIRLKPRAPKLNQRHPLARGLLGAWPFYEGGGGTLHDLTGNRVNGTLTSGQPWAAGQFGSALSFNGSTQSVNLGNTLNPAAVTYSVWIKPRTLTNAYQGIVGRSDSITYSILLVKSTGKLALYASNVGVNYDGTGSHTLTTGNWYHLVLTYSATAGLVGYVNGVVDGTAAANGALNTSTVTCHIGNDPGTVSREFDGFIDNVLIYNRALSAAEVAQLYFDPFAIYRRPGYRVGVAAGGTAFSFPTANWHWNGQAPSDVLAVTAAQKAWHWNPQAPVQQLALTGQQKAWRWNAQAPATSLGLTAAQKGWAWAKGAPVLSFALATAQRAWNWLAAAPTIAGGNISVVVQAAVRYIGPVWKRRRSLPAEQ
jgi:hypothetical protein